MAGLNVEPSSFNPSLEKQLLRDKLNNYQSTFHLRHLSSFEPQIYIQFYPDKRFQKNLMNNEAFWKADGSGRHCD